MRSSKPYSLPSCLLLLCLLPALPAQAGMARWTPFGPGGGMILDLGLVPGDPATLYARAEGGVFRSLDGGESWTWRGRSFYGTIAADPMEPGVLYAVDNYTDQVYRSSNGGAAWAPLPAKPGGEILNDLDVLQANGGVLYGGGDRGVFTSLDGGETWMHTVLAGSITSIAVVPGQPLTAIAGARGGVWKTSDGGLHWSPLFQKSPGSNLPLYVAVSPDRHDRLYYASGGEVYRTEDGGTHWQPVGGLADVYGLTVDAAETVYAAVRDGVQISRDLGATWSRTLTLPVPLGEHEVFGVTVDPDRPGTAWAGTLTHGIRVSHDGGLSWTAATGAGLGYPATQVLKRDPRRPGTLYLIRRTWADRLLASLDDGRTWAARTEIPNINDLAFDLSHPAVMYAVGDGIFHSDDGGISWTSLPTPSGVSTLQRIVVKQGKLFVGSFRGAYRSDDGGYTWEAVLSGDVIRMIEDPKDPKVLYIACAQGTYWADRATVVYRTRNHGVSWRRILTDAQGFAVDPVRHGRLYATRGDRVYFSRDRGNTWQTVGRLPGWAWTLAADSGRSGILLAGTHGASGVILSRNGGRTWVPYNVGLAKMRLAWAEELMADPLVPGRFFTLPFLGGTFEVTVP